MRTYVRMRWDEQRVENDLRLPGVGDGTVVRTFDAPEAMGINFHEVRARSALNHVPGGRYGFNWTINPYRGCTHACVFCFARRTHTYLDLDAGRDFEREIVVKVNVPELLRAELARPSWKRELVALGTNTDPYQWVESRYRMMPEILAALEEAETPVSVLTKSPLVMRDVEIFERMAKQLPVSVNLSVPTLDEKAWRATEPHTPSPAARLDAVAELRRRGIDSGVLIAPLMPGINDSPEQVQPIVDRAREAGATFLGGVALHLRDEVKDVFFAWLEAKRPDLLPRYEAALPTAAPTCAPTSASSAPAPSAAGAAEPRLRRAADETGCRGDRRLGGALGVRASRIRRSGALLGGRRGASRADRTRRARQPPLLATLRPAARTGTPAGLCRPGTGETAPRAGSAPPPRGRSRPRSPAPAAAPPTRGRGRRSSGSARRCRSRPSPAAPASSRMLRFVVGAEAGDVADRAQLAAVVEAEDQRADRALLFARPPAHHHAVDRRARASPSPSPCACRGCRGRRAASPSRPRCCRSHSSACSVSGLSGVSSSPASPASASSRSPPLAQRRLQQRPRRPRRAGRRRRSRPGSPSRAG